MNFGVLLAVLLSTAPAQSQGPLSARWAPRVIATVHPSAILRAPDEAARHAEMDRFVADLTHIPPVLGAHAA